MARARLFFVLIFFGLAWTLALPAAQLPLTFGAAANGGTGQTLRSAMGNAQTNFTELYSNVNVLNSTVGGLTAIAGETNYLGNAGATNASNGHVSWVGPKVGPTNQVLTVSPGANITITNEGTNVVIASSGGSGNTYDANQFAVNAGQVVAKSGIRTTNENAFGTWTNTGTMAQAGTSRFYSTLFSGAGAGQSIDPVSGIATFALSIDGAFWDASGL